LTKIYDGKRPRALDLFLKITNMTEDQFYNIVESHVVYPNKMPNKEFLKKNVSNIVPTDFEKWSEKFD
jgi:hypothetical protein